MNWFKGGLAVGGVKVVQPIQRSLPMLMAAGILTAPVFVSTTAAQSIDLSTIAAGAGPGFAINGQATNDQSGFSVSAAGDVNGDGLGDLIVGARFADPPGSFSGGRTYIVFGKTGTGSINLSAVTDGTLGLGFAIDGAAESDNSGISVSAAGDINGDGLADVVVGAHYADVGAATNAGRTFVVFGKTSPTTVNLSALAAGISGFGYVINGEAADDQSGFSVAGAGDVNGDGRGDIVIGARFNDLAGLQAGRAYVVFGKVGPGPIELSSVASGASTLGFPINAQGAGDQLGFAVSGAGDVNGDGLADVIVGAPFANPPAGFDGGRAYVVFGKTGGGAVSTATIAAGGAGPGFVINGQAADDELGRSVSGAGDVTGDGFADLIVGAPRSDPAAGVDAGRAYLVFGKTSTSAVNVTALVGSNLGFAIEGDTADGRLGTSVSSAGDVNSDGRSDLLIGAYLTDTAGGLSAGRSFMVLGKSTSATVELSALAAGTDAPGFAIQGEALADYSGRSVSTAGDVNGDGFADLIIGGPQVNAAAGSNSGRSYVIFNPIPGYDSLQPPFISPSYFARFPPGAIDRQGVGTPSFGNDGSIYPDSRCWVDFVGGANASTVVVNLRRNNAGISNLPGGGSLADVASARWTVTTNRLNYGTAKVSFRYTDAEVAGLNLDDLTIYQSTSGTSGPWTPLANPTSFTNRNEVAGDTTALAVTETIFIVTDIPPPIANGDADADGFVNVADYTAIRNLLAGEIEPPLPGDADANNDGVITLSDAVVVREFVVNGVPLP